MEQDSEEWKVWRRSGFGSSDAPIVMSCSPYASPFMLWQEKLGLREPQANNFILEKGKRLEVAARANYEILHDYNCQPMLVTHKDYPFLRASLDGANVERKLCLEIKYLGVKNYEMARDQKKIVFHHMVQCQHQLLCSGFERCHYFAFNGTQGALVEVLPDLDYMRTLLASLTAFWSLVIGRIPPAKTELDFKEEKRLAKRAARAPR